MSKQRHPSLVLSKTYDLSREFFRWWLAELAALSNVRHGLIQSLGTKPATLEVRPGKLALLSSDTRHPLQEKEFPYHNPGEIPDVRSFLSHVASPPTPVVLRIFPPYILSTTLALPITAKPHLSRMLPFQLDSVTPFKPAELYYTFHVANEDTRRRRLSVAVDFTPRSVLDDLFQQVTDCEYCVSHVEFHTFHGPTPLPLPASFHDRLRLPSSFTTIAMTCATFTAAYYLAFFLIAASEIANLDTVLESKRRAVSDVLRHARHLDVGTDDLRYAANRKRSRAVLPLLSTLSTLLSDGTHLSSMRYHHPMLIIEGISGETSTLLGRLDTSTRLSDVEFLSPIKRVDRIGSEAFSLRATRTSRR